MVCACAVHCAVHCGSCSQSLITGYFSMSIWRAMRAHACVRGADDVLIAIAAGYRRVRGRIVWRLAEINVGTFRWINLFTQSGRVSVTRIVSHMASITSAGSECGQSRYSAKCTERVSCHFEDGSGAIFQVGQRSHNHNYGLTDLSLTIFVIIWWTPLWLAVGSLNSDTALLQCATKESGECDNGDSNANSIMMVIGPFETTVKKLAVPRYTVDRMRPRWLIINERNLCAICERQDPGPQTIWQMVFNLSNFLLTNVENKWTRKKYIDEQ